MLPESGAVGQGVAGASCEHQPLPLHTAFPSVALPQHISLSARPGPRRTGVSGLVLEPEGTRGTQHSTTKTPAMQQPGQARAAPSSRWQISAMPQDRPCLPCSVTTSVWPHAGC